MALAHRWQIRANEIIRDLETDPHIYKYLISQREMGADQHEQDWAFRFFHKSGKCIKKKLAPDLIS